MASERDRIIRIKKYLESSGISVNIGKNKARGNRGVFIKSANIHRIDIAKNLTAQEELSVLVHEFAHFLHCKYDKSLKSLDFIFGNNDEMLLDELRSVTVHDISKKFAMDIFNTKASIKNEINNLANEIKVEYPDFRLSKSYKKIEEKLKIPYKFLLSYDRVKYFGKLYSVCDVEKYSNVLSNTDVLYVKLRSKQRQIRRINSKIKRINNYYNNPTELFARFMECFFAEPNISQKLAPHAFDKVKNVINNDAISELKSFYYVYFEKS